MGKSITKLQFFNGIRRERQKKNKRKILKGCPQKRAVCVKVLRMAPKKPNSAKRMVLKVAFLGSKKRVYVHTPGECYQDTLQQYSWVLIRGGRTQDLPGLQYKAIRNKFDFKGIYGRKSARSKYGSKDWDRWEKRKNEKGL